MNRQKSSVTAFAVFFSLCLVLLQEGFNYYLSFQILALVLILFMTYASRPSFVNTTHLFLVILALSFSVAISAAYSPTVVSRNAENIFLTTLGLLAYAVVIICLPNFSPRRVGLILQVFNKASAATVLALAGLIVLTDLSLLPFLNREALLFQNSRLVTNYVGEDALLANQAYRMMSDLSPRLDLFYGEPSYLGIVLFTCVACYMLTTRLIVDHRLYRESLAPTSALKSKYRMYVVVVGALSMLYLQSLSSIMYALLVLFFEFRAPIVRRLSLSKLLGIMAFVVVVILLFLDSFEYALYRITMQESLSLVQRFGSLLDFGIPDYLLGLKDESRIPSEGFHNGLFYIIAISGFAGIWYIAFLLRTIYRLARPVEMSVFLTLLILALIMQNGAVFSPNKVVLLSLILLPLSCSRAIYPRSKPHLAKEAVE